KIAQIVSRETFVTDEIAEQVEIQIKYEGYIQKSNLQVEKMKRMEDKKIPENIDYDAISGLATEALEKLKK
ncbi:tRNA uridine-5-carboxymethylaminomethyl(34) synthesis enzyme MnmG, partial [Escherichia coli]|nr:tRNA uridine-5-carboxymethylaminomethyl(34) synthesis enzyme MnmG [Escherichia coli]